MTVGGNDILVVNTANRIDDHVLQRLSNNGYNLHTVAVESESLSYIRHHDPDLVLICVDNPSNGLLGFVKEIRATRLQLPVLLLLNPEDLSSAVPILEQGATDYALLGADELLLHVIKKNIGFSGIDRRVNRETPLADNLDEKLRLLIQDQQAGMRVQSRMMPEAPVTMGGLHFDHQIFPH